MTKTQSAISWTTSKSWVMNKTAKFRCCCNFRRSARMDCCTVVSSAVVGSSAMSTSGEAASASAIMMRCFWPPLNSWGYFSKLCSGSGNSTSWRRRMTCDFACALDSPACTTSDSATCQPTRMEGFRDDMGSWNTMLIPRPNGAFPGCPAPAHWVLVGT